MPAQDRQIPILLGQPYCTLCGKGNYCREWLAPESEKPLHTKTQDQVSLDYHTKVVVIDANIDEGQGRGWKSSIYDRVSSRRMSPQGLRLPFYTESVKSFKLVPYAAYHKRRFFSGEPSYYEVFFPDDLVYDRNSDTIPNHRRQDWVWDKEKKTHVAPDYKKGDPHKAAGGYLGRARVATLGTLTKGACILYKDDKGEWREGSVGEYEGYQSVRRRIEQANRKRRARYTAYMKRVTLWEHLEDAD